jgi:hypothetical protein
VRPTRLVGGRYAPPRFERFDERRRRPFVRGVDREGAP